ncbi:MAG: DNA replication and repair protein RecF [Flavobacteriaceae bacterium]|nr:DNA replication and repair protein RecF [Flavobacteriaceae bacterium]|tara:strand:+ start:16119 stop:17198 length:1080 start_codon:yes stop_codon:yes gene_type:complete
MFLHFLNLSFYKNFSSKKFNFESKINCFIGKNGVGKSNILDSIYHLAYGKSFFNPLSFQNINFESDFFAIEGHFEKEEKTEKIICGLKKGEKKIIKRNNIKYKKIYDHIGLIQTVMISPLDQDLISDGSFIRRKFIDSIIGQVDKVYLKNLVEYKKVITQRNSLLKFFSANRTFDQETLEIYNHQLIKLNLPIFKKRKEFISNFINIFTEIYNDISDKKEYVNLEYKSDLFQNDIEEILNNTLKIDKINQHTTKGIHKDDLLFSIGNHSIKKYGSQGQQKTFLISLKLAKYFFIKSQTGNSPILLFDDAFDKLDQERVSLIIEKVKQNNFGQIFITDTHYDRTVKALSENKSEYSIFEL